MRVQNSTQIKGHLKTGVGFIRRWADLFWVKIAASLAVIGLILALGPLVDVWRLTEPSVDLAVTTDGRLDPFLVKNRSAIFSMKSYTPDCVVTYALWKVAGNIVELWTERAAPSRRHAELRPGDVDNFLCDLESVMERPTARFDGKALDLDLLEVRFQIRTNYETGLGPLVASRTFISPTFCGIRQQTGFRWIRGETTTPDTEVSKERDVRSFYAGYLTRCFSPAEARKLLAWISTAQV